MKPPFPKEHGVWAMLWTALIVGTAVAGSITSATLTTSLGLSFLLATKAPLTTVLRSDKERYSAAVWLLLYGVAGLLLLLPLMLFGVGSSLFWFSLFVMVPTIPWYFYGLRTRREMKIRFEIPAMALLALAAPYACAASGLSDVQVMVSLWLCLTAFYVASSFRVRTTPGSRTRTAGLGYNSAILVLVCGAVFAGGVSPWLLAAYAPLLEDILRSVRPRKERISFLGRLELAKTVLFAFFLTLAFRQ